MLCSIIKVTHSGTVLIDNTHWHEFEPRLPSHDRNVQVVAALRNTDVKTIGLGNIVNVFQFSRVEDHANMQEAIKACIDLPQTWPAAEADTVVEILNAAGATLYTYHLLNATINSSPGFVRNSRSYHTLTITGGLFELQGAGP